MQDAQNLIEEKKLPTDWCVGAIYSSSCERQCKANQDVTTTKYFCFFINATRSKKVNNLALQLMG